MPPVETLSPEAAVRLYLMYLDDPSKLVDQAEVKKLEKSVESAKDPIEKLKAYADLERAKAADPTIYQQDFVKHAKAWSEAEGIPPAAFRQLGVPEDVLTAAGLAQPSRRSRGRSTRSSNGATRRSRMKPEQLTEGILAMAGEFTIKDVTEQVGSSPQTIKGVLEMLEAQGKVTPGGEKAGSRGRAAKAWRVASGS